MIEPKFKREPVKWLRDGMKSQYKARETCFICACSANIELHHVYSVSEIWNTWLTKNKLSVSCDEDVLQLRKQFEMDNAEYLHNDNLYSLCKPHHVRLHQLFGKSYSNYTAKKVIIWLDKQRQQYGEILDGQRTDRLDNGQDKT
jgi:hypothetical protein